MCKGLSLKLVGGLGRKKVRVSSRTAQFKISAELTCYTYEHYDKEVGCDPIILYSLLK